MFSFNSKLNPDQLSTISFLLFYTLRELAVEYGYSILGPVSKRTFVKWCFLEKEKDFPTHFYHPYSFLS